MLFKNNTHDSLIFNSTPMYMEKTNKNGRFYFLNLKKDDYKIYGLTNNNFIYEKNEKIAFTNDSLNFNAAINLYAYNPLNKDSILNNKDSILNNKDSILNKGDYGSITIITKLNNPCVFQLLQNNNLIYEFPFNNPPYKISNIKSGKYMLKYIQDVNNDSTWNHGDWRKRIMPEKIINYNDNILIRNDWDLEIDWEINLD